MAMTDEECVRIDKLLDEYYDKFNDWPPMKMMPAVDLMNMEAILRDCLESGKPYELPEEVLRLMEDPTVDF